MPIITYILHFLAQTKTRKTKMRITCSNRIIIALTLFFYQSACDRKMLIQESTDFERSRLQNAAASDDANPRSEDSSILRPEGLKDVITSPNAYDHSYRISIDLGDTENLCETTISLSIPIPTLNTRNEDESSQFNLASLIGLDNLDVTCLDIDLPVGDILSLVGDSAALDVVAESAIIPECDDKKIKLTANNTTIGLGKILCTTFEPALPLFPAVLAGDPKSLRELNISHMVSVEFGNGPTDVNASLVMQGFEEPYTSPVNSDLSFKRTMAWQFKQNPVDPDLSISSLNGVVDELSMRIDMDKLVVLSMNLEVNILSEIGTILGDNRLVNFFASRIVGNGVLRVNIDISD